MKRYLVFMADDWVTFPSYAGSPGGKRAADLLVGDYIIQTGRQLKVTSVTVNGQVRIQAED